MEIRSVKECQIYKGGCSDSANAHATPMAYKMLFLGIFLLIAASFCEVLWKENPGGAFELAGYFLFPISFLIFYLGGIAYIINQRLLLFCTQVHLVKIVLYTFLLMVLLLYGFLRGNIANVIVHDSIFCFSIGIFLILGTDDKFFHTITKFLTVVFWAAFIMCLLTYDMPRANMLSFEKNTAFFEIGRFADSIAFTFYRPYIQLALPLFIYGWLEKTSRWHYPQILSLVGYVLVNVMIFKFRGALVFAALVSVAAILMPGSLSRKLKMLFLAVIAIGLVLGWMNTKGGAVFTQRIDKFDTSKKVVQYRIPEAERYFEVMGNEWLWGRGLGASYKYDNSAWGRNRTGVHIGWVTFTLKGGLPLLIVILSFYFAWINKPRGRLRHDSFYTTAWFWIPIAFVNWIVNPISIIAANVPVYGLTFLLLARFGKRTSAHMPVVTGSLQGSAE
jgi:hypothetical protein